LIDGGDGAPQPRIVPNSTLFFQPDRLRAGGRPKVAPGTFTVSTLDR